MREVLDWYFVLHSAVRSTPQLTLYRHYVDSSDQQTGQVIVPDNYETRQSKSHYVTFGYLETSRNQQ